MKKLPKITNSFETDLRHEEVTYEGESVLCAFKLILNFVL